MPGTPVVVVYKLEDGVTRYATFYVCHLSIHTAMAVVIRNIEFLNNPAKFSENYQFRVTFDCPSPLNDDIEWKLTFVSCPDDEKLDQELDSLVVGPIPKGINQFEFDAAPPDPTLIRKEDVLGVSALIFTGSYKDQEFVRVGYYQNTEFDSVELNEDWKNSTSPLGEREIRIERLVRDISTKPRVTRFQIRWDVAPSQGSDMALGAANSAPVPSADDIGAEDTSMQVDSTTVNGAAAGAGDAVTSSA